MIVCCVCEEEGYIMLGMLGRKLWDFQVVDEIDYLRSIQKQQIMKELKVRCICLG